ncbi:membrane lipoprotein lipid attachment site-containing protein [Chryseobacterium geocarposphaerae]|uniref:Lipoprotein n=1 Tax=Chryseobacterium geocarposphaerae TaxID=1416776 RepID=A0A2M9C2F8_9FLAO|nr:membrane lipoprotein lipid attachment site-containing protein [Chryseobacterium geocarposphaerae]PJJ64603.1 hypothetical protein CLV73_2967 [Chryseobacterium geocarposphaerae]
MKNIFSAILILLILSACSNKEPVSVDHSQDLKPSYDTTAIDSFSAGATSEAVIMKIKMSSQQYQDSIKQAAKLQAEEKRIAEELEKENKKKQEEEKKKASEEKQQKTSESSEVKTEQN